MAAELRSTCSEVIDVPPVKMTPSLARRATWRAYRFLTGHAVRWKSTRAYARLAAENLRRQITSSNPTVLFNAMAGWDVAKLDSPLPLVNCIDSTVPLASELGYPLFRELSARDYAIAIELEGGVARRAALNLVSTEWAARSLVEHYCVARETIRVIPLGANLDVDEVPPKHQVIRTSRGERCRLLFLGVDWVRKGGDLAYQAFLRLLDAGVPAELIIVGCEPPKNVAHPGVHLAGRLQKTDAGDRKKLGTYC